MLKFNELFPSLNMTTEDYFNEFREEDGDLAVGAKARFVLKGTQPRRFAYVLTSKPVVISETDSAERKEYLELLDQHEFYFIALFEEDNPASCLILDETYADLDEARNRSIYCLQRYSAEDIINKRKISADF